MNIKHIAGTGGAVVLAALAISPQVLAQGNSNKPPQAASVTLDAKPSPVVFSSVTTLSGKLSADTKSGVVVNFEADTTKPYGDKYTPIALATTTNAGGQFSVAYKPAVNTQLRAIAKASPPVTSNARLVLVRPLVGLRVSDSTPRRGSLVTFSGSVFPAHDGTRASIQRRTASGGWVTVARPLLNDAGTAKSTYTRRIRIFRDDVYRVKVAGHDDHVNGFSRPRTLTVHG
ncbi:MAG: hypothetical protein QOJ89_1687 [bacterium]|jgi:hypothetical protein